MQYFRHQVEARQLSRRLVLLFALGVVCVTVAISAVMLTLAATLSNGLFFFRLPDLEWLQQHPANVIATVVLVVGIMAVAVLLKRIELRDGGGAVARSLGGERISADSSDPLYRRLHNVVEEMAIASGTAVPEVYVLPRESGINAFAAGMTPASAAIAVTRGALELLTRDELQAVVAHEFSHIINNDIRLNFHLIAWLHGLMALSVIARGMLRFAPSNDRGRRGGLPAVWIAAFAVMVLGYVGLLFGRLMQAAVARRREMLADASAVQFTRNSEGLRGALLKIAASDAGGQLQEVNTDEVTHLLFFPPAQQWFATHPPLKGRIAALGAAFDAAELARVRQRLLAHESIPIEEMPAPMAASNAQPEIFQRNVQLSTSNLAAAVGQVGASQLQWARQLHDSLPEVVTMAASNSDAAIALLFSLTLSDVAHSRVQQVQTIRTRLGAKIAAQVEAILPTTTLLSPVQRQPALFNILPQLRQLSADGRLRISSCLQEVVQINGPISVTHYALCKLAQSQLHDAFAGYSRQRRAVSLAEVSDAAAQLLSVLVQHGHSDDQQARLAYERAMQHLALRRYRGYQRQLDWPHLLDLALMQLDRLAPMGKQWLIEAMSLAVTNDAQITVSEAELLRTFCACLHCPLPPLSHASDADA